MIIESMLVITVGIVFYTNIKLLNIVKSISESALNNELNNFIDENLYSDNVVTDEPPELAEQDAESDDPSFVFIPEETEFDRRIARMKAELADQFVNTHIPTDAVVTHPGIENIPHDAIPESYYDPRGEEYAK